MNEIIGISTSESSNGKINTTLYLASEFSEYQQNPEEGRSCVGRKAEAVYVGGYDCSSLRLGMKIEIYYDKAISTAKGTFQPVKRIEIISSAKS